MQNTKTKILTVLLLSAITLAMLPLVSASTGNIIINSTAPIQPLPITPIPAGSNISLNFLAAPVTFSGSQFYLLFSQDGLSQVSVGDLRYTPLFNVAAVLDPVVTQVPADPNFPGQWTIGYGWVNGTTPLNIPGGIFYVKAFDGATTALAVTQGIPVIASFRVTPIVGGPGTSLLLQGNAFPANALVNLTYFNSVTAAFVTINNLTPSNALGQFNYTVPAPDVIGPLVNIAGDNPVPASNIIEFRATENATGAIYSATYTEMQRGLLQFGRPRATGVVGSLQNATGVFGNLTDFTATVSVGVGDSVRIVGNWFYPGNATFRWDNAVDITPSARAANGTGYFNTTITVPATGLGPHNITIVDSNSVVFAVFLNVVQSITINPTSGPIGQVVTVSGFGFPATAGTNAFNATITFDTTARGWALTDANGAFTTTITVPTATGGAHTITATTNDTALTAASKTFTVTSSFQVSPSTFYANSSNTEVKGMGTGFDPAKTYFVAIDNQFSPFTNTTNGIIPNSAGNINFSFVGVGFTTGMHIVSVYEAGLGSGLNRPFANATFTVLADASSDMLAAINQTLVGIGANVTNIHGDLVVVAGDTAFIRTATGTTTASLSSIQATLSSIQGSIAGLSTPNFGPVLTSLDSIKAQITALSGNTATIDSKVGTLQTTLDSIGTTVTSINGNTATISTSLGTLTGKVDSITGTLATITTSLGTITTDISELSTDLGGLSTDVSGVQTSLNAVQADVTSTKAASESLSPLIIVAIVLALIAAIAAIASIVLMRRKIAG